MIRVFLLDDHEVVRRGVRDLLETADDLEVVGEAGTAAEAVQRAPATAPDVAVLDVRLPDGSGIEVCRDLRSLLPELRCLMLTSFNDDEALFDAVMAGASGYVLKEVRGVELIDSVRSVAAGPRCSTRWRPRGSSSASATRRRTRCRPRCHHRRRPSSATSPTASRTARSPTEMFLAEKTVKNYVSNLLGKLGMTHRTQAAVYAARLAERRTRQPGT